MFPKIICDLISSIYSDWCTPLTVPNVPTGINIGVWIMPLSNSIFPVLAFDSESLDMEEAEMKLKQRMI